MYINNFNVFTFNNLQYKVMKRRTKHQWLQQYDNWLEIYGETDIYKSYILPEDYKKLSEARTKEDTKKMFNILNDIWFYLPDSIFNIMSEVKVWSHEIGFLNLIELYDDKEKKQITKESKKK